LHDAANEGGNDNMVFMRNCSIALVLFAVTAPAAYAHHLWVTKTSDTYDVARGLAPDRIDPYSPECVRAIKAFDCDGQEIPIQRMDGKERVRFQTPRDPVLVTVGCEWGHRVDTTQGKKLMTKREAQQAGFRVIDSFSSTHFSKTLFGGGDPITKPAGMMFEIVPRENPFEVAPREQLSMQLIFDGKPLADTAVFSEKGQKTKTDKNGIAHIQMKEEGQHLIWAKHRIPDTADPEPDYHVFRTFLTFEVR